MKKIIFIVAFTGVFQINAFTQIRFSIATDVSVLRNFSPQQKFWAFGQTVQGNFHFSQKESAYAWITYYGVGRFTNSFTAPAKSPATMPATMNYNVTGRWRYRQVSLGWKHYFKGSFDEEINWNIYGIAGFGLLFVKAENIMTSPVDTSLYALAPIPAIGINNFKRLTIDLGMGTEYPLGGDVFLYGDVRTSLPASDYPSTFFHNKKNIPFSVTVNAGIRILFNAAY